MRDDSRLYNPVGFAAVIAHRLSLNHLRRKPSLLLESGESASQTNPSPLDEIIQQEDVQWLEQKIKELPSTLHAVLKMRQNVDQPYNSTFITLAPKFTGNFTHWLSTDYRLTYTNNQYKVDAVSSHHSALRQNLSVTLLPTDKWHIAFGAEHYFMRFSTDQTASITFLDASVRWLLSKRIDLALTATNLLDETDYRYTSFGSLSESFFTFSIRPRNVIIKMQIKI